MNIRIHSYGMMSRMMFFGELSLYRIFESRHRFRPIIHTYLYRYMWDYIARESNPTAHVLSGNTRKLHVYTRKNRGLTNRHPHQCQSEHLPICVFDWLTTIVHKIIPPFAVSVQCTSHNPRTGFVSIKHRVRVVCMGVGLVCIWWWPAFWHVYVSITRVWLYTKNPYPNTL